MSPVIRVLLQRIGTSILVLFGVSILIFAIARVIPGDPARIALGPNATAEAVANLREQLHLNDNIVVQYGYFLADLLRGNSIHTYSERGYDYAVEKASTTAGWSFTMFEENWNYGFPQEMAHFVQCVRDDRQSIVTGEDGRATLEIIMAAYASAGQGKKIMLPFETDAKRPIDLWRK